LRHERELLDMARPDSAEVTDVERRNRVDFEPLGAHDYGCINGADGEVSILCHQFRDS
jgi:hypothetical protein